MKNFFLSPASNAVMLGIALLLAVLSAVSSAAPADLAPLALGGGVTNFSSVSADYITATTFSGATSGASVTATVSISTPLLYVEGIAQSGPVRFGSASTVISGTTIAHGLGTTPTSFIAQNAVIQAAAFTQTLYAYGCNTTSCTVGISEGSVVTFTTVNWITGR